MYTSLLIERNILLKCNENMGSMYSHKSTGSFEIEEDEDLGYI